MGFIEGECQTRIPASRSLIIIVQVFFLSSVSEKIKLNRIILVTTQDMEEADLLGDRIAVMHEGREQISLLTKSSPVVELLSLSLSLFLNYLILLEPCNR